MTADLVGELVRSSIAIFIGLYFWMLGLRKIGKPPGHDADYDAWHDRFGGSLRIFGPLLFLWGVASFFIAASGRSGPF